MFLTESVTRQNWPCAVAPRLASPTVGTPHFSDLTTNSKLPSRTAVPIPAGAVTVPLPAVVPPFGVVDVDEPPDMAVAMAITMPMTTIAPPHFRSRCLGFGFSTNGGAKPCPGFGAACWSVQAWPSQ